MKPFVYPEGVNVVAFGCHGCDYPIKKRMPPGSYYITEAECGMGSYSGTPQRTKFAELFKKNDKRLSNPTLENIKSLSIDTGINFHVHYDDGHEQNTVRNTYMEASLGFLLDWDYSTVETKLLNKNQLLFQKSGVYLLGTNLNIGETTWVKKHTSFLHKIILYLVNYTFMIIQNKNNIPREAVNVIFEESIYPTVDTINSMLSGNIDYESLKKTTHICNLSDFLKPNKIVYNLSCRSNCIDTSHKILELRRQQSFDLQLNPIELPIKTEEDDVPFYIEYVFSSTKQLKRAISLYGKMDMGYWDVSKITDMSSLFENSINYSSDIDEWNTSNVINMERMFYNSFYTPNLNEWGESFHYGKSDNYEERKLIENRLGNVTNMKDMFMNTPHYKESLENWKVPKLITFGACNSGITHLFEIPETLELLDIRDMPNLKELTFGQLNASIKILIDSPEKKTVLNPDTRNRLYREFVRTNNRSAITELNKSKSLVYDVPGGTKRKIKKNKKEPKTKKKIHIKYISYKKV
jgi:hypothetical protein